MTAEALSLNSLMSVSCRSRQPPLEALAGFPGCTLQAQPVAGRYDAVTGRTVTVMAVAPASEAITRTGAFAAESTCPPVTFT